MTEIEPCDVSSATKLHLNGMGVHGGGAKQTWNIIQPTFRQKLSMLRRDFIEQKK